MPTYQNLFTNPSFETAAGTVTVRTNLDVNPRMLTATNWTLGGSVTRTLVAGGQQLDVTAALGSGNILVYQATAIAVAAGDKLGGSFEITVPAGYPAVQVYVSAQGYISGASTGGSADGTTTTINPGQTVTVKSGILTPNAGTDGYRSILRLGGSTPAGARIVVHNSLVEKNSVALGSYFDGTTAAAGDFTYAWAGTADASASYQNAPSAANALSNGPTQGYGVRSADWAAAGTKSLRVMQGSTGTGFCYIGSAGTTIPVVAGGFYTFVATGRMTAAQTGSGAADPRSRSIAARFPQGSELLQGPQLANSAGQSELRWTFQVPAGRTTMYATFWQGINVIGDVWWDSALLVAVPDAAHPYTGPAYDGSTPSRFGYVASWNGAADASTSTLQTIEIAVTPYVDENPSPRAEVFVEDPPAGFVTLTLFAEKRGFPVPGGIMHPAAAGVSVLDTSAPFGIPITYQAQFFDPAGVPLGFLTSDQITVDCSDTWVSQPLDPSLAVKVDLDDASATDLTRAFDGDTVYTDGATVGVWVGGRRRGLEGVTLNIETAAAADADMLQQILGGYDIDQVPVICVRTPPGYTRLPRLLYMTAPKPTESDINVRYGGSLTIMRITGDEVRRPAPGLITPLLGYDDIDAFFGTYSAIDANYGSYLARDRDYSKAGYAG